MKSILAITMGDPADIGPEVTIKAFVSDEVKLPQAEPGGFRAEYD